MEYDQAPDVIVSDIMESVNRPDLIVAPLSFTKDCSRASSNTSNCSQRTLTRREKQRISRKSGQITPPLTPQGSQDDLQARKDPSHSSFQTYLRAFYSFHPTCDEKSSTITLPLNYGDIILIHSVHTNGWADGTLLSSGARGWLPTNYCEPYNSEPARVLLKALTKFWDLAKGSSIHGLEALANQDYVRGLVAGVRCLLERTSCLNRESSVIQSHRGLRRNRKALLADLSSFVKTARQLEDLSVAQHSIVLTLDEIIMKAFKVVTRGVKFLDIWNNDLVSPQGVVDIVPAQTLVPPTPPADCTVFGYAHGPIGAHIASTCHFSEENDNDANQDHAREPPSNVRPRYNRSSRTCIRPDSTDACAYNYQRQSISHRLSTSGNTTAALRSYLASVQLNESHDTFLGFLGSFIGLQLQSRSSSELLLTTQQSVTSCQKMLRIVEEVFERDQQRSELLREARDDMYHRIYDLVEATRDVFRLSRAGEHEDILMPTDGKVLMDSATACVRAAGDCVVESRYVLEQIGDFVFEPLGLDLAALDKQDQVVKSTASIPSITAKEVEITEKDLPEPAEPQCEPPPPPTSVANPHQQRVAGQIFEGAAVSTSSGLGVSSDVSDGIASHLSVHSLLPPLPAFAGSLLVQEDCSPSVQSSWASNQGDSANADCLDISSSGGGSTYIGSLRDSESSAVSQASTRATSPDNTYLASSVCGSFATSQGTLQDECEETENKVLEKTFAHELVYNKDGQISGGTLPALIERLTTHDSTPDASFVCTFYLTFRLFATPVEFAQALIDRFQYVGESPSISGPVRLRVYNVLKGWLESHWRHDCDSPALELIVPFASRQLLIVLPTAGKRLAALAEKVNAASGPLVPRLVSSIGKTNTSIATYVAPDSPMPAAIITKHQMNLLKAWKHNGANISILDFDTLELARQFTLKESRIFCSILPEELLATEWTKKSSSMAVNVRAMSRLSTDLANLVADSILASEDHKKRAITIKQWVKIAKKCLQLENYDSLMAIICSLNSSTILRLKRTWDQISSKTKAKLDMLKEVVEISRNYAALRQRLQNTIPPCIPFVGTYLTDLTFVDVGNQTTRQLSIENDDTTVPVINFGKHMKTAKIISELQRFQIPYRITEVPELQTWIQDQLVRVRSSEQTNVQNYYRRSLLLEPRDTTSRPH
ncbi:MAG: hypothetical protein L6R36_001342 [Xanthoria steineri]|nr:MAG: hypothetical protein L6R36_001342 [Xanthoria steineri]